ncbi:hypothetical protein B0H14DRAFT_3631162 [Mycena olivaceomarginata]|nr:hypothetical protein B0H14DRAFT_3631162 [Mycena olivaceomarginata]
MYPNIPIEDEIRIVANMLGVSSSVLTAGSVPAFPPPPPPTSTSPRRNPPRVGYPDYAGTQFTKDEVLDTIKIKSSSSSNDNIVFSPENLMHWPKAKAWYASGGDTNKDLFNKMTTAKFKRQLLEHRERGGRGSSSDKNRVRRHSPSSSSGEGSSRKHKRARSITISENESEDEPRHRKTSSKPKRAPKSITSDTLDR